MREKEGPVGRRRCRRAVLFDWWPESMTLEKTPSGTEVDVTTSWVGGFCVCPIFLFAYVFFSFTPTKPKRVGFFVRKPLDQRLIWVGVAYSCESLSGVPDERVSSILPWDRTTCTSLTTEVILGNMYPVIILYNFIYCDELDLINMFWFVTHFYIKAM